MRHCHIFYSEATIYCYMEFSTINGKQFFFILFVKFFGFGSISTKKHGIDDFLIVKETDLDNTFLVIEMRDYVRLREGGESKGKKYLWLDRFDHR